MEIHDFYLFLLSKIMTFKSFSLKFKSSFFFFFFFGSEWSRYKRSQYCPAQYCKLLLFSLEMEPEFKSLYAEQGLTGVHAALQLRFTQLIFL